MDVLSSQQRSGPVERRITVSQGFSMSIPLAGKSPSSPDKVVIKEVVASAAADGAAGEIEMGRKTLTLTEKPQTVCASLPARRIITVRCCGHCDSPQ